MGEGNNKPAKNRQETAASQESKKPLIYNSTGAERRPGLSAIAQLTVGAVELDDDSTPHRLIEQYLADKKEFLEPIRPLLNFSWKDHQT